MWVIEIALVYCGLCIVSGFARSMVSSVGRVSVLLVPSCYDQPPTKCTLVPVRRSSCVTRSYGPRMGVRLGSGQFASMPARSCPLATQSASGPLPVEDEPLWFCPFVVDRLIWPAFISVPLLELSSSFCMDG